MLKWKKNAATDHALISTPLNLCIQNIMQVKLSVSRPKQIWTLPGPQPIWASADKYRLMDKEIIFMLFLVTVVKSTHKEMSRFTCFSNSPQLPWSAYLDLY